MGKKTPVVGVITAANAQILIKGGLIDVATAAAVAPLEAEGRKTQVPYEGPSPDRVEDAPVDSEIFQQSLLGKATSEARKSFLTATKAGLPRLTPGQVIPPARIKHPEGAGFTQDFYPLEISRGYDRRGIISVTNWGDVPQTFVIKPLESHENLAIGLKGEGSQDEPCTLEPGEWKYVRLIVNATKEAESRPVELGLWVVPKGQNQNSPLHLEDKATINLHFVKIPSSAKLTILKQEPGTLAYTCSIVNQGEEIHSLTVAPAKGQEDLVWTVPEIIQSRLPAGGSLTFQVIPSFPPGVREMTVTLEGDMKTAEDTWSFDFRVPEGKSVFYGLARTTRIITTDKSTCTNHGAVVVSVKEAKFGKKRTWYTCDTEDDPTWDPPLGWRFKGWLYSVFSGLVGGSDGPPPITGTAVDVRGATIRANVKARLSDLEENSINHPMAVRGDRWNGFVNYAPAQDGMAVNFVAFSPDGRDYLPPIRLNEPGHSATWPYIRASSDGSRAFVVWEDSKGDRRDLAFRASREGMRSWEPVQYLTSHGKGVSDPILHITKNGLLVAAWEDLRMGRGNIHLRLSRDDGKSFEPDTAITIAEGESQTWPQISVFADDKFALTYTSKVGPETRIVVRILDDSFRTLDEPKAISNPGISCGESQIASDSENNLYAVWRGGDGAQSEIWFVRSFDGGQTWSRPVQLTKDKFYSEYPLVGWNESGLWVSYHSDISGVADLKYVRVSQDKGETWTNPITMPSMEETAEEAWLEVTFSLQWPRSNYQLHNTSVSVNGRLVGEIRNKVPEGTFIFKVPPEIVNISPTEMGYNEIKIEAEGLNQADYVMLAKTRLIVKQKFAQVQVMARSQSEADDLAQKSSGEWNHSHPDLALAANEIPPLPGSLKIGQKVDLPLLVYNLGEVKATGIKIAVYRVDPRDPTVNKEKARLAEKTLSDIPPGGRIEGSLSFKFDRKRTPRVYVAVRSREQDFNYEDNVWGLSFTAGESYLPTPLLGTDIPNIFYAPDLISFVNLPNIPALEDLITLPNFESLVSYPGWRLPDFKKIKDSVLGYLEDFSLEKPDWIDF